MPKEAQMATVQNQPDTARTGRLKGKVAVITGASSGIGRATMELFGREGAIVVGTARREAALQEGLDKVKADGSDGIIVPADLEDVAAADRVAQAALDTYGRIDVLVCNAGVGWQYGLDHPGTMAGIHEASLENWRDILGGVDLEGYFLMIHACLPHMIEAGRGSIVEVPRMAGITGHLDAPASVDAKDADVELPRLLGISYSNQRDPDKIVSPRLVDHALNARP